MSFCLCEWNVIRRKIFHREHFFNENSFCVFPFIHLTAVEFYEFSAAAWIIVKINIKGNARVLLTFYSLGSVYLASGHATNKRASEMTIKKSNNRNSLWHHSQLISFTVAVRGLRWNAMLPFGLARRRNRCHCLIYDNFLLHASVEKAAEKIA